MARRYCGCGRDDCATCGVYVCPHCGRRMPRMYKSASQKERGVAQLMALHAAHNARRHIKTCKQARPAPGSQFYGSKEAEEDC